MPRKKVFNLNTFKRPSFNQSTKNYMYRMEGDGNAYTRSLGHGGGPEYRYYRCGVCDNEIQDGGLDIDHIINWKSYLREWNVQTSKAARKAYNDRSNLRLACRTCNSDHKSSHLNEDSDSDEEDEDDHDFIDDSNVSEENPEDYNLPESMFSRKGSNDVVSSGVKRRRINLDRLDVASDANGATVASDAPRAASSIEASSSSTASLAEGAAEAEEVLVGVLLL